MINYRISNLYGRMDFGYYHLSYGAANRTSPYAVFSNAYLAVSDYDQRGQGMTVRRRQQKIPSSTSVSLYKERVYCSEPERRKCWFASLGKRTTQRYECAKYLLRPFIQLYGGQ